MTPHKRNWIVGLVVLLGLGSIVWMILLFAGRLGSLFAPAGIPITIRADQAAGVSDGSGLYYLGQQVGRVNSVHIADDNISVDVRAEVYRNFRLPANVIALIEPQSAFGSAANIGLRLVGTVPVGTLSAGMTLEGTYQGGVTQIAEDLRRQQVIQHLDQTLVSIREQSEHAGQLLASIQHLIGDEKLRQDLQTAVVHIRTASESAERVGTNLEKFTGNLQQVADNTNSTMSEVRVSATKLGSVLEHFDSIAAKIDQGKGTAGLLVSDPKLYQGLLDTTKQLNITVSDLQRVIQQWEQEGVTLKLGK
ncbi:MAG TPA: MlaD family protein [Tepidisphaeraceae bacterium]|nr:MlaD family protein [Tepidisphaeraceae bacterium]